MPTHIVGDFDSVDEEVIAFYKGQVQIPIREFNPVKDATDTEIALRLSLELGSEKVWMLGATGTRLDHVWANVQILRIAHEANVEAYILDECNRISLWENRIELKKAEAFGTYFSIFPFDGDVEDVCIVGAKYPLEHFRVTANESRCVSNEVIEDVTITFSDGLLILMETRDKSN
jgi:thiamine pyrophosphokinase